MRNTNANAKLRMNVAVSRKRTEVPLSQLLSPPSSNKKRSAPFPWKLDLAAPPCRPSSTMPGHVNAPPSFTVAVPEMRIDSRLRKCVNDNADNSEGKVTPLKKILINFSLQRAFLFLSAF